MVCGAVQKVYVTNSVSVVTVFFFFQAEDGIRDYDVTGVQTCALPIYYNALVEQFGKKDFIGLFSTDKNGILTSITPPIDSTVHIGVVYFILNVMMNQRVRMLDNELRKVSEKIVSKESVDSIIARVERIEAALFGD
mgnify:CR=1 FL=1